MHSAHTPRENPNQLMTVKEAAEYLRIPLPTIYYLLQRGQIPGVQIGGRWRIDQKALDKKIRIVTLAADSSLQKTIKQTELNEDGSGIFARPENQTDENTDIYITTSRETTPAALGLSERFAGIIIHVLDNNPPAQEENNHYYTTTHDLQKTVNKVAHTIRQKGKNIG